MITVTALKWVPDLAKGQVRDYRVRWILKEAGWDYQVRLLDAATLKGEDYRQLQPFGQVPVLEEDGRPPLFESGAIVWSIAERADILLPADQGARAQTHNWMIAALNSVEPHIANMAEARYFLADSEAASAREAQVLPMVRARLGAMSHILADRTWLADSHFTVADLMMASVFVIADRLGLLDEWPILQDYLARATSRPAYRDAVEEQLAEIARHGPADMGWDPADFK